MGDTRPTTGALEPDPARLASILGAFSSGDVGGTPRGGVSRPAASDADKAVRDRFASISQDLDLTVRVDDAGNMYARREGTQADALPLVIGSHLDTVVPGGRFDGILGVAIALETVGLLNDAAIETLRPIEVVNWTGEEGARFPPAMLGSGVVTGAWDADYAHSRKDAAGFALGDELSRIGYLGSRSNRLGSFFASLEAHIEQGTTLEQAEADVGIVSVIEPVRWCTVRVEGRGGHAGSPGPEGRAEAIVAACRMITAARDAARDGGGFRTTVGKMAVEPGATNVIPHLVTFDLDLRSTDDESVERHLSNLSALFEEVAADEGVEVQLELFWAMRSGLFDERLQNVLRRVAEERRVLWIATVGRIGHDSLHLAGMGPTAMLFTRTREGLSHCEEESAPWDSIVATADVFANATLALANAETLAGSSPPR
jgi:N-carbamoyl-L-amino-acid hydrolase